MFIRLTDSEYSDMFFLMLHTLLQVFVKQEVLVTQQVFVKQEVLVKHQMFVKHGVLVKHQMFVK